MKVGIFRHSENHSFQQTCHFSTNKGYYRSCFIDKCQPNFPATINTMLYGKTILYKRDICVSSDHGSSNSSNDD